MPTAIVLGTFDGLHNGHRAVISLARGFYTVAVTFNIPPKFFSCAEQSLLMTVEDKAAGLKKLGVNEICTLDFGKVSGISPAGFLEDIVKRFSPSLIVCGFNYRFGKGAAGNTDTLAKFCKEKNIELKIAKCVGEGEPVSSSMIRTLISGGNVAAANELIFGGFGFTSAVLHGDSRGSRLGFPTVNQVFPKSLTVPKFGVYESRVIIDKVTYKSITNLGMRPTYKTDYIGCETFIKGFSGDVYGKEVTLKLIRFIREEKKFSGEKELSDAVRNDIKTVLDIEL